MTRRILLLAVTALSAAALCLPSVASAGSPQVECGGEACGAFSVNFGLNQWSMTNGFKTNCTSITGTGNYSSKTGGTITLTAHGCIEIISGLNTACTTFGQPNGTVALGTYSFDNTYLTDNKTKPGILITGILATYTCYASHTTLTGGLIGELESGCTSGPHGTLSFAFEQSKGGHQKYMQSTGTGAAFDLSTSLNSSPGITTGLSATGTLTPTAGKQYVVTCS